MRVPAVNKALHESVGAVRIQSFNTRSSKILKRSVLFNHKKDKVCVMTNTKLFLLLGTSLSFLPQTISAAECAVTDCSLLGYTDSACPGSGLKCPFGEGWYCGGRAAEDCIKLGYDKTCTGAGESGSGETCNGKYQSCTCDSNYKYTCTGTGYSGGSGSACGGKYTACTCSSGYEWKNESCQALLNGPQGNLFYCNNTVVGVKTSAMNFYIAMKQVGKPWTSDEAREKCLNHIFCGNLKGYLPTKEQLTVICNNRDELNNLLTANGAKRLGGDWYWSSTDFGYNGYIVDIYAEDCRAIDGIGNSAIARPILTSW